MRVNNWPEARNHIQQWMQEGGDRHKRYGMELISRLNSNPPKPFTGSTPDAEGTVIVALTVKGATKEDRQRSVMNALAVALEDVEDSNVEDWWIADDERYDGSSNASAVFVEMGNAYTAFQVLNSLELTGEGNDPRR